MTKKGATKGKKTLTGKRIKTLTEQQRLRRVELKVQRVEVQLYAESTRDGRISEFLEALPHGEKGDFVKRAIYAAIIREEIGYDPIHADIIARLADLQSREYTVEMVQAARVTTAPLAAPRQSFDDGDSEVELEIVEVKDGASAGNFLNSLMTLQG